MKISIKDYNLQNIMFVHNFVLIFLIFVLLFVSTYLVLTVVFFNNESVFMRMKHKFTYNYIKNKSISLLCNLLTTFL